MNLALLFVNGLTVCGCLLLGALIGLAPAAPLSRHQTLAAEAAPAPIAYPTFNSPRLDEQLRLYRQYLAELGPPDILIVGSSRALVGIDPQVLQQQLGERGYAGLKVYNFGINGATGQVVDLLLRQILPPEHLPRLVLWADGVRAFNSGRTDRTYRAILQSAGYQRLLSGERPTKSAEAALLSAVAQSDLTSLGFLGVSSRFQPALYYQRYPRIAGQNDGDYWAFNLDGKQTSALSSLIRYSRERRIALVFVNLPLTQHYLDPTRRRYEAQFQQYLRRFSERMGLIVRHLNQPDLAQPAHFLDPSHLNRYGAAAVAAQLAQDPTIPWPRPQAASPSRAESSGTLQPVLQPRP